MPNQSNSLNGPFIIFIVGPSAVGKSETGLSLAKAFDGEIVCCDAMQVYREVDIASDKPSQQARACIPHHLVDLVSVTEEFNAARYRKLAQVSIQEVFSRGKTPLVVGGSGMYMSLLLDGIFEGAGGDEALREKLTQELKEQGAVVLHDRLRSLDPQAAARIHPNDPQRIIRALEVVESTGQPISGLQPRREGLWGRMPIMIFALNRPREELYRRSDERVEAMFADGLVDEVKKVSALALSLTAQKIIGIPEVTGYLNGTYDIERAKYLMKLNTRHYIKRQLTWFRRDKRITWIEVPADQTPDQVADIISVHLR